tara:strand:+ start:140 stop:1138 length:999 start_codon:yes stop_codon:yes gene_type:complete
MNVLFIGNAIIDVISHVDEMDQVDPNLIGKMQIVSHSEIINKIKLIPNKKILSGGSSNNSACGLSMLDEKVYFIGKIGNDQYGKAFLDHNKKYHIKTNSIIFDNKSTTGLSLIYVTPDGQRTMYTCPGASSNLSTSDIPKSLFKGISGLFIEGYLFYSPYGIELVSKSVDRAIKNNGFVAISLSDVNCVDKYRDEFLNLIKTNKIQLVFGNKMEMMSLLDAKSEKDLIIKMREFSYFVDKLIMTSGKDESLSMEKGILYQAKPKYVEDCIDTTGAGDLFVSGYLKAYLNKSSPNDCLNAGNYLASKILNRDGGKLDFSDIKAIKEEIQKYIL